MPEVLYFNFLIVAVAVLDGIKRGEKGQPGTEVMSKLMSDFSQKSAIYRDQLKQEPT